MANVKEFVIGGVTYSCEDETARSVAEGKYSKPSDGIPKTDLASSVQTSLGKADTALQSVPSTYRTASDQDVIDAAQDTVIASKASAADLTALQDEFEDFMYGGKVSFTRYTLTDSGGIGAKNISVPAGSTLFIKLISSVVGGTSDYAVKIYAREPDNPEADSSSMVILKQPVQVGEVVQVAVEYEINRFQIAPTPWKGTTVEYVIDVGYRESAQSKYLELSSELKSKLPRVFMRVGCVGDSYTSGHIQAPDASSAVRTNEDYAWPSYMGKITGHEWLNFGESGATCLNWMERTRGLPAAQTAGVCQAYVVGLMINDATSQENGVPVGTSADMGTDADTYYGGMVRLINALLVISPQAHIFVQTCPRTTSPFPTYNQAIKDIVAYYNSDKVHCLDLAKYKTLYDGVAADYSHAHYTAIGYELFAEILCRIMSEYMWTNLAKFQEVYLLPYESGSGNES